MRLLASVHISFKEIPGSYTSLYQTRPESEVLIDSLCECLKFEIEFCIYRNLLPQ